MEENIVRDMPAAKYHATKALGSTAIVAASMKSVAHYLASREKEATEAMARGNAVHAATLQPEVLGRDYVIAPVVQCLETIKNGSQCSRRSLPGAEYCKQHGGEEFSEAFYEVHALSGVEIVTETIYNKATETATGIRECIARSEYPGILDGGEKELSLFAHATLTNNGYQISKKKTEGSIAVKARLDLAYPELRSIIDLKGSMKPDQLAPRRWKWKIADFGLNIQAALYMDIFRTCFDVREDETVSWSWLAHEQDTPFACAFFDADGDDILSGRLDVHEGLRRWKEYADTGDRWVGWPRGRQMVSMPQSAKE